jgi:hypothetical protein
MVDFDIICILKGYIGYSSWADLPMKQRRSCYKNTTRTQDFLNGISNKKDIDPDTSTYSILEYFVSHQNIPMWNILCVPLLEWYLSKTNVSVLIGVNVCCNAFLIVEQNVLIEDGDIHEYFCM